MRKIELPSSGEFQALDFLRFFSAYGIVIYHYQQELRLPYLVDFFSALTSQFNLLVDLFFVISGFVISFVYLGKISGVGDYVSFMQKRVARLWPLHILILAVYVAIWFAANWAGYPPRNPSKYDFACVLPHVLLIHSLNTCDGIAFNYVSWSISAEFFMYLIAPVLFVFAGRRPLVMFVLSVGASLCLAAYSNYFGFDSYLHWTTSWGALRAFPAFCFGVFLFLVRDRLIGFPRASLWFSVSLLLYLVLSYLRSSVSDYLVLFLIYFIVVSAVAVDVNGVDMRFVKRISPFGHLTYSLYMLHPLIQTVFFSFVASRLFALNDVFSDLIIFLMLPLLFWVSYLSLTYIEAPLRRLVSRFRLGVSV